MITGSSSSLYYVCMIDISSYACKFCTMSLWIFTFFKTGELLS